MNMSPRALPLRVFVGYSVCIFLYPACIISPLYPYYIYIYIGILHALQQIHSIPLDPTVSRYIPLYLHLAVSSYIQLYPAVFRCILPPTISHRLENNGISLKIHAPGPGEG